MIPSSENSSKNAPYSQFQANVYLNAPKMAMWLVDQFQPDYIKDDEPQFTPRVFNPAYILRAA